MSIWLQDNTKEMVIDRLKTKKEGKEIINIGDRRKIEVQMLLKFYREFGMDTLTINRAGVRRLVNAYMDIGAEHRYNNIIESMVFKTTNMQKAAILIKFRSQTSEEEFKELVKYMTKNGIISDELRKTYVKEYNRALKKETLDYEIGKFIKKQNKQNKK